MAASASSAISSISPDLYEALPNKKTPWIISPSLFSRLEPVEGGSYKKSLITTKDPEWDFIQRYFDTQKPKNRSIGRVWCIHNSTQTDRFLVQIRSAQSEANNAFYAPQWERDSHPELRSKIFERWEVTSAPFSEFSLSDREGKLKGVIVLPLWHGTTSAVCDSICKTGFAIFGKQHIVSGGSKGKAQATDSGFFGNGIYFTTSSRYAADIYSPDGNLFLSWVSMRQPFPVIADKIYNPPQKPLDMEMLRGGQGAYQTYNAHYIPVVSIDPSNPLCPTYYPCAPTQTPVLDEIVVFNGSQTLPRFWLELILDLVQAPSLPHANVGALLNLISFFLTSSEVKKKDDLIPLLEKKSTLLACLDPMQPLSKEDHAFYQRSLQLLNEKGKVNDVVSAKLAELLSMQFPPQTVVSFSALKEPAVFSPNPVFGKAKWNQYIGDVGEEPFLPKNLEEILNTPCPIWSGQKVKDTHTVIFIPKTINGKPLTIRYLGELLQNLKEGKRIEYKSFPDAILAQHGEAFVSHSQFILITKELLPDSRSKLYCEQEALIGSYSGISGIQYEIPTLIEAAVSAFVEIVMKRENPSALDRCSWCYTRCRGENKSLAVGGTVLDSCLILADELPNPLIGIAAMRSL